MGAYLAYKMGVSIHITREFCELDVDHRGARRAQTLRVYVDDKRSKQYQSPNKYLEETIDPNVVETIVESP